MARGEKKNKKKPKKTKKNQTKLKTSLAPLGFCRKVKYLTGDWTDYLSVTVSHDLMLPLAVGAS